MTTHTSGQTSDGPDGDVAAHVETARRIARSLSGPGIDADDLEGEALAAVAAVLHNLAAIRESLAGCIATAVYRAVIAARDRQRRRRTREAELEEAGVRQLADPSPGPDERAQAAELWDLAERLLTPRQALVLALVRQGLEDQEIADTLQVRLVTVRVTRKDAIDRLRRAVE